MMRLKSPMFSRLLCIFDVEYVWRVDAGRRACGGQYYQICGGGTEAQGNGGEAGFSVVVAAADDGKPALAERAVGDGRGIECLEGHRSSETRWRCGVKSPEEASVQGAEE